MSAKRRPQTVKVRTYERFVAGCHAATAAGDVRKLRRKRLRALYAAMRDVSAPYRAGLVLAARQLRGGAR